MRPTTFVLLATWQVLGAAAAAEERGGREIALNLDSSSADVALAGTLRLPEGRPVRRAALLLPVAGPTDRDLSLGDRGIYRAAAELLAAEGTATLRIADRGVDGSGGDWRRSSLADRLADALVVLDQLAARPELVDACTGIIGMSEGAVLALAAAADSAAVEFVVALSPPLESGVATLRGQRERLLAASPAPDATKEQLRSASEALLTAVAAGDEAGVRQALTGPLGPMLLPPYPFVPQELEARIDFVLSPWYRSQVVYDPAPVLAGIRGPVLAVFGGLDRVIDAERSADLLRRVSSRGLREPPRLELRSQLNHLMMPAVTGSPVEYGTLPEIVSSELWGDISEWVRDTCGGE